MDEKDIGDIIFDLDTRKYKGLYYIQNFRSDNDRPTLGMLPPQKRALEISKLPEPENFDLAYRNF